MKTIKQHQLPTADLLNNFEDLKCKMTKEEIIAYNEAKVSHLPFYWLSRIIKHCNILIDNLLTFRK